MALQGINVPITSSWNGKGVKSASKDLGELEGLANKLTKRLAAAFTVGAIANFAKSSVQAFSQANKQFTVMAQTLNNLGFNVGLTKLEDFFNKLEMQFGKDKSVLIPAFQTLINSTKDFTKSQDLLNLALDVSAGSGKDLGAVAMALGKAYAGQTTALTRLGIGLSTTSLKGKSFIEIQKQLTSQFSGSAASAVGTFQGQLDLLKVSFDNMKETIGKGIVDSINLAFGGNKLSNFQNAMKATADYVANIALGMGVIAKNIKDIYQSTPTWVKDFLGAIKDANPLTWISNLGKKQAQKTADMLASLADPIAEGLANYNNRKKSAQLAKEAAAQAAKDLAAQKAITDQKKQQLALTQAKAILDKSSQILNMVSPVFDIQAIEIYAALQQVTNAGDKARLQLMQDMASLQRAIANNDETLAAQIAQSVQKDVQNLAIVQGGLNNLKSPDNPLKSLLDDIAKAIAALQELQKQFYITFQIIGANAFAAKVAVQPDYEQYASPWQFGGSSADKVYGMKNPLTGQTIINVAGSIISEQQLSSVLSNQSASGIPSNINRLNVNYGMP